MTWYNTGFKQRQAVAIDATGTADATTTARDTEFGIPADWDLFWDNIRSDFFDVVVADPNGNLLSFSRKAGASYANRVLILEVDGYATKGQSVVQIYVYFQNPTQSSDLSVSTTMSGVLDGHIELSRPTALAVSQPLLRSPSDVPQTAFVKASTDEIDVYFSVASILGGRSAKYNNRLLYEGINYVNIFALNSAGANDTGRYDETQTRFVGDYVRVRAKGGSSGSDYALVCRIVTTETQQIDIRCLIQVRDQLPSS